MFILITIFIGIDVFKQDLQEDKIQLVRSDNCFFPWWSTYVILLSIRKGSIRQNHDFKSIQSLIWNVIAKKRFGIIPNQGEKLRNNFL